jgi:hypothetical protein
MGLNKKNNNVWRTLTVGQWQMIQEVQHLEGWDLMRSVTAIVDGGYSKVDQYSLPDLRKRYESIVTQLNEEPYKPFKNFVKVKGKRYWMNRFFEDLCTAQFVEISEWTSDQEKINQNIHLIVASLMREVTPFWIAKRYDGNKHPERAKDVKESMLAVEALGLSAFFLGSWMLLLSDSPRFLSQIQKQAIQDLTPEPDLQKSTSG